MYSNKINPDYGTFCCDFCGVRTDCGTIGDGVEPSYCFDCEPVPECIECGCDSHMTIEFDGKGSESYCAECIRMNDGILTFIAENNIKATIRKSEGIRYRNIETGESDERSTLHKS